MSKSLLTRHLSRALFVILAIALTACRGAVEAPPTVVAEIPEATEATALESLLEPTTAPVATLEPAAKAPVTLESIDDLLAAADFQNALVQIEVALQTNSDDIDIVDLTLKKVTALQGLNRNNDALVEIDNLIATYESPEAAPLNVWLAQAALTEQVAPESLNDSWAVIAALAPDNVEYQLRSIELAEADEAYDIVVNGYQRLIALDEGNLDYQIRLGTALQNADLLEDAELVLADIVALDPENPDAWLALALNSYLLGADEKTKTEMERALELGLSEEDAALVEELLTDLED